MPLLQKRLNNLNNSADISRPFTKKPATLNREELEYTAQKIFTYATIGLAAITVYASVTYLVIQQLKK